MMPRWTRALAAAAVALTGAGCAVLMYSPKDVKIKEEIVQARRFEENGDFKGAIAAYEQTLKENPAHPWLEETLFSLGRLHASSANPDKDFNRSLFNFLRLGKEFPKSRLTAGIRVWMDLIAELAELETKNAEWTADAAVKARKIKEYEALIQTQKAAIEALQQQLAKMKEIDIQSETKAKIKK